MKKLMTLALGLSLLSGSAAFAADHRPDNRGRKEDARKDRRDNGRRDNKGRDGRGRRR